MRCLLTLVAVVLFVPAGVKAQSSVTLKTTVSEVVTLSSPDSIGAESNGNTVRLTLPSSDSPVIRVPLLVRSNIGFEITAVFESETAMLRELLVADVRAMGRFVSPEIVDAVRVEKLVNPNTSQPLFVVSGPRVSLGGTLNSPNNALQITVLIRLKSERPRESPVHLTFVAKPVSLIQ
jgi:hypothetical protein